ncbi:MAG TPA: hypothetical protein VFO95_01005 [Gemmatimonadales bacterium]|nr:hypothetical protein [Gemmatimonadales bacterium]
MLFASTLLAGCVGGLWLTVPQLARSLPAVFGAGFLLAAAVWLGARLRQMPAERVDVFAGALIAAGLLFRLGYVLVLDEPATTDFRDMWRFALRMAESPGTERPADIEQLRALPFLTPLAFLSHGRALSYQVANCVALAVTSLLAYRLARRHLGAAAAALGLFIATVAPEPTLAAEIPTHDIAGTLFLLGALLLLDRLDRWERSPVSKIWGPLATACGLGLVLFLLDLQRGLAPFLMVAATLVAVLPAAGWSWRVAGRRVLLMVGVPVALMSLGNRVLDATLEISSGSIRERHRWFWLAAYASSTSSGTNPAIGRLWRTFSRMTTPEVRDFGKARVLSDFADRPAARVPNYLRRVSLLHQLGFQLWFYLPPSGTDSGSEGPPVVRRMVRRAAGPATVAMAAFFLAAAIVGLILHLVGPRDRRFELPLITCGALVVALCLLGEAQPRYLFPYWFLLTPIAAIPFVRYRAQFLSPGVSWSRLGRGGLTAAGMGLAIGAGALVVDRTYHYADGRLLPVDSGQVLGKGRLVQAGVARVEPDSRSRTGILVGSPAGGAGELVVFAKADTLPRSCSSAVRASGSDTATVILAAGEVAVVRFALPVDTVSVTVGPKGSVACPVELAYPRSLIRH